MPASQKIVPISPNSSDSSAGNGEENLEEIILSTFKIKSAGTGATRNTLVENDSLSSYSLPEDTNHQDRANQKQGETSSGETSRVSIGNGKSGAAKTHTVIEIENDQNDYQQVKPTYVEAYLTFMFWTCVSPFNPDRRRSKTTRTDCALNVIQKILFWTMIGFSFIKSFFQVKYFVLYYMTYSDVETFIDMMLYIMNAGTKLYYVYLFVFLQKQFTRMQSSLEKLRAFRMPSAHSNEIRNYSTMKYAIVLGISSIIMSLIQTIWLFGINEWTPQNGILFHTYASAVGFFTWSKEKMGNDTWFQSLEEDYYNTANTSNILLGVFGLALHFCSCLHNESTGDLMQTQAETVREEMSCLQNNINNTENDEQNITLTGFFRENGEWAHSRLLTQAMDNCNDALDPIMKFKHVNNLMLYVFFVLNFLDGDHSLAYLANLFYDICKSSYTYRIAVEASTLNDSKKDWIRRLAWKSKDKEFLKRVPLLLEEIKEKPIGMGKGQFMINENFVYRFLGWVGSVFVLQAQSREAKPE